MKLPSFYNIFQAIATPPVAANSTQQDQTVVRHSFQSTSKQFNQLLR